MSGVHFKALHNACHYPLERINMRMVYWGHQEMEVYPLNVALILGTTLVLTNITLTIIVAVLGARISQLLHATRQQSAAQQRLLDQIAQVMLPEGLGTIPVQLHESDLRALIASAKKRQGNGL